MCRLFGMNAGTMAASATFWLLEAPDSLEVQSRRNVDGSGIGFFEPSGLPVLDKAPEPGFSDEKFISAARHAVSTTFVAHVRWATAGGRTVLNTHPFAMQGRIMAHNGGFSELGRLDEQLGRYGRLVLGDTDSERYFALITQQIDVHDGDVGAGIAAAARWIGTRLPVTSLNTIVAAPGEMWALRYPGQRALHVIERPAGDSDPAGLTASARQMSPAGLHVHSAMSSMHAPALHAAPTVLVASEELDGESGWRMLAPGELIHVRPDLSVESAIVLPDPPARLVTVAGAGPNIDT
jgi:predicted glutamine amidotransferase